MTNNKLINLRGLSLFASLSFAMTMIPSLAAATPSYTFDLEPGDMQGNFNVPRFTLTNTSTEGEAIMSFSITIGDEENFFYDFVADMNSDPFGMAEHVATETATGAQLVLGDRVNDRSGTAQLDWTFDDFDAGEELIFQADIDPISAQNGGKQSTDSRYAFLNNGDATNATLSIVFSDGSIALRTFDDHEGGLPNSLTYAGIGEFQGAVTGQNPGDFPGPSGAAPVPEPGAALLFGFGLLTAARKPRQNAAAQ